MLRLTHGSPRTGHETSSHTLTWVLSLLARNTDWQEKLYAEVSKVDTLPLDEDESVGDAKPLEYFGYEEMANFPLVLAATIESLRMRDLAMQMTRVASRDTTLSYTTWDGDAANPSEAKVHQHTVAIPKGTRVHLDTAAFGVNPFKWEDPQTYNPTRHLRETEDVNGNKKVTVRLYSPSPLSSLRSDGKETFESGTNIPNHVGLLRRLHWLLVWLASVHWQTLCRGNNGVLPGTYDHELPLGGRARAGRDPGAGESEGFYRLGTVHVDTSSVRSALHQALRRRLGLAPGLSRYMHGGGGSGRSIKSTIEEYYIHFSSPQSKQRTRPGDCCNCLLCL